MPLTSTPRRAPRILRFISAWGRAVTWGRMLGAAIFVPIMLLGMIASPESRLVSALAIPVLLFLIWRDARYLRSGRAASMPLPTDFPVVTALVRLGKPGVLRAQFAGTWRVGVAIVVFQLTAAVSCLFLKPYPVHIVSFWFGGAAASLPGFLIGVLWHRMAETDARESYRPILGLYALIATMMTLCAWPIAALHNLVQRSVA